MAAALLHKVIPLELFETRRLLGAVRRRDRPCGDVAARPTRRRPARRARSAADAGAVPDLLRAYVHESEGCAIRRCDGDPDAGPGPSGRGISLALAADHPDRRSWRRPVDRFAHPRRARAPSMPLSASCRCSWRRFTRTARARLLSASPMLSTCCCPAWSSATLVMGLIWPWSIMEPANPFHALTYFSHFFEKPWKEMFDGALVSVPDMPWSYLPDPVRAAASRSAAWSGDRRRRRAPFMSLSRTDVPARRKTILLMLTLAATLPLVIAMVKRPALYSGIRHFIFVIPPMTVLAGVSRSRRGMNWLKENRRSWQPAAVGRFLVRPAAAARRNDPVASLPIHPLQPHRRHGSSRPTACSCWITGASR